MALLKSVCKPYVVGFIVAVVINTIQGVAIFAAMVKFGNVVKEGSKIMSPFVRDSYPATSIIFEVVAFWVRATLNHVSPKPVKRVTFHPMPKAVPGCRVELQASAGAGVACAKGGSAGHDGIAARASAQPFDSVNSSPDWANSSKPSKLLIGNVFGVWSKFYELLRGWKSEWQLRGIWGMILHVDYLLRVSAKARDAQRHLAISIGSTRVIIPDLNEFSNGFMLDED